MKLGLNKTQKIYLIGVLGAMVFAGLLGYFKTVNASATTNNVLVDNNARGVRLGAPCTVGTATAINVGTTSTSLLATSSTRAWASIQLVTNASSSIALALNDVVPTANSSFLAAPTTSPSLVFGIQTPFPYTGAVRGIVSVTTGTLAAGNASTSVLVTECNY